jgi:hypothetical protein
MAKATAKKRKVIVESGRSSYFCYFQQYHHFFNKGEVISGLQLVKWVLEVLKKHSICSPNGSRRL